MKLPKRQRAGSSPQFELETVKATLECARADIDEETDRMKVLDQKLTSIGAFSGIALSIGGSVGSSVVVAGELSQGFTIALGSVLGVALVLLLAGAVIALRGLMPKDYAGTSLKASADRLTKRRLSMQPEAAIARLAATYRDLLPQARATNKLKVTAVRRAYVLVGFGLGGLALGLILSTVGAVV